MATFEGVEHLNVDLGTVESTITSVDLPRVTKSVKSWFEGGFSLVPKSIVTKSVHRSSGQLKFKLEAELTVGVLQEV